MDGAITLMRTADKFLADFCITLCHLQISVSHLALKGEQVTSIFQIKGRKAMPDLIGREFHSMSTAIDPEISVQPIGLQPVAISSGKEPLPPHLWFDSEEFFKGIIHGVRQI